MITVCQLNIIWIHANLFIFLITEIIRIEIFSCYIFPILQVIWSVNVGSDVIGIYALHRVCQQGSHDTSYQRRKIRTSYKLSFTDLRYHDTMLASESRGEAIVFSDFGKARILFASKFNLLYFKGNFKIIRFSIVYESISFKLVMAQLL